MENKTDLELLKEIFERQAKRANGWYWDKLIIHITRNGWGKDKILSISNVKIGFYFDKDGNLVGVYDYSE